MNVAAGFDDGLVGMVRSLAGALEAQTDAINEVLASGEVMGANGLLLASVASGERTGFRVTVTAHEGLETIIIYEGDKVFGSFARPVAGTE